MTDNQKKLMEELLRENLLISTGCTEPIAIAYASAVARKHLAKKPSKIFLKISKNMAKNAMDAGIPNSNYVGAAFVSALGALYGDSEKGFQLLEGLSKEQHNEAYRFSKENVQIEIADTDKALYIEVRMDGVELKVCNTDRCCIGTVKVIVADGHNNICKIEKDGEVIYDMSIQSNSEKKGKQHEIDFSLKEIFEYVKQLKDFSPFEQAITVNKRLSEEGQKEDTIWGLNVGKVIPFGEETKMSRILSSTAAAVDARMAGADFPAVACTGSGNQGITTTLSVYQAGIELKANKEEILKAIAISDLTAIFVKRNLNVLSYLCGAVIASCGASAGITYLMGGDYETAEYAVKNVLSSVTGMFCDGAKSTCALKVLACVNTAIYAATMATCESGRISKKVGIARKSLTDTIRNIAKIESETTEVMDSTIMDIIIESE